MKVEPLRGACQTVAGATANDADRNFPFKIPAPDGHRLRAIAAAGAVLLNEGRALALTLGGTMTGLTFEIAACVAPATATVAAPNQVLNLSGADPGRGCES